EALRVSNISWAEQHVGGHADRTKTWRQMSWWERRNSEVDDIAQGYADELIATNDTIATNPKFFSEPCAIYINNEKVSCLALESVDKAVVLPELMEYWAAKGRLWPIVHQAMKSLKPAEQRFITKHTVGMCSVSKFGKRWGLDSENRCPLCGLEEDPAYTSPAALPPGPRPSGNSYSKNSKNGSSPPPLIHPSPNSLGPFFAPSAPLTTSLEQRLRGTAYTECLLPPSPTSVRLNSALAPSVSSKAFSSTARPTSSNNSTALAVVADPVTAGLPIYLHSSSLSVKACGSIAMMSFILTTTSSTNSARLLSIDASTKSLTWVFATYLGTFIEKRKSETKQHANTQNQPICSA
ncbi:unnamed protein product, partial [Cylindrotheca closterium]